MVDQNLDEMQEAHQAPDAKKSHISKFQLGALFIFSIFIFWATREGSANAYLQQRSVSVSTSVPGALAYQEFQFDAFASPAIGSVVFEYCENSPLLQLVCDPPVGFDSSVANLVFQSGDIGYIVHPNTVLSDNRVIITRPVSASSTGTKRYRLDNITNPTASSSTTYVRITTHASIDGSGPYDDTGSVAFSTQAALSIGVYVPPHLTLCTGLTVATDCTSASGFVADMGELSKTTANSATTQFAVATNSFNGYSAMIIGPTMTAGNQVIPALTAPSLSQPGASQFGINLRQNSVPSVGSNVTGAGTGNVSGGYSTANVFRFQSGDTIASSALSTEWNRYTISYLVNVADGQPAGRYSSTLTVIATTTF